jgi:hypothetical protein
MADEPSGVVVALFSVLENASASEKTYGTNLGSLWLMNVVNFIAKSGRFSTTGLGGVCYTALNTRDAEVNSPWSRICVSSAHRLCPTH